MPSFAVLAIAAVPLLAPSGASAALAGGNPIVSSVNPALRSVTTKTLDATALTQQVEFCFDKAIGSAPVAASLVVGDYDRGELVADSASRSSANCALATFNNDIDAGQFTYGTAGQGAAVSTAGDRNILDSSALAGAVGSSGTRGLTVAPDLVGITVNNAASTITYTFDQKVTTVNTTPMANDFTYTTSGTEMTVGPPATPAVMPTTQPSSPATAITGKGTTALTVTFPAGTPPTGIGQAVKANVATGVVRALGHPSDVNPGPESAVRPGTVGQTSAPDVLGASLATDGKTIGVLYDEPIANPGPVNAFTADGTAVSVTPVAGQGSNTISYLLDGGAAGRHEFFVAVSVPAGSQTGGTSGFMNTVGFTPIGGNAGALATGYTTAPDAQAVSFDATTNTAIVVFDSRVFSVVAGGFRLTDSTGTVGVASTGAAVLSPQNAPTQTAVRVTFPSGVSGARGVQILEGTVTSPINTTNPMGPQPGVNPVQALSQAGAVAGR